MSKKPVYWCSPVNSCDICSDDLNKGTVIFDANTRQGIWGLMCKPCYLVNGVGLGLGKGQKYEKQPNGKWLKTAG